MGGAPCIIIIYCVDHVLEATGTFLAWADQAKTAYPKLGNDIADVIALANHLVEAQHGFQAELTTFYEGEITEDERLFIKGNLDEFQEVMLALNASFEDAIRNSAKPDIITSLLDEIAARLIETRNFTIDEATKLANA